MLEKIAEQMYEDIKLGNENEIITKLSEAIPDYVRRYVKENAFSEQLFVNKTVTMQHRNMQRETDSDVRYYIDYKETGAIAAEVSVRGETPPRFVDTESYKINIGKIESEPLKKPWLEIQSAEHLLSMIKTNNAEAIRRTQDLGVMKNIASILTTNGTTHYVGGDTSSYATAIDWSDGPVKKHLTQLMAYITRQGLLPEKWLMSQTMWDQFVSMDAGEIGDLAGQIFQGHFGEKKLVKLPVVTTIKTDLEDESGIRFFDYTSGSDIYTDIYLFVAPQFLGKMIKVGDDRSESKWEGDILSLSNWRYVGHGFGDTRGVVRMRVKIK